MIELPTELTHQTDIKCEPQNHTKRIKKEPKPRKRTRKSIRRPPPSLKVEEEEGKIICLELGGLHLVNFLHDQKLCEKKMFVPDEIKEEEMEIETLEYDNDDFANDPSFTITSILDDKELAEDELNDIFANADADEEADGSDSDLDESQNTPRKRRRKAQLSVNKTFK